MPLPPLPLTIYLYLSWQQAEADQLWTGRIAARGIAPLCGPAREKFSRDLNLYARKWKLLRGFDRIYSTKTLCSYFISCANKFFSLFFFFFFQIQNFIGIKNRNYKITQLFQTDANLSANSSSSFELDSRRAIPLTRPTFSMHGERSFELKFSNLHLWYHFFAISVASTADFLSWNDAILKLLQNSCCHLLKNIRNVLSDGATNRSYDGR